MDGDTELDHDRFALFLRYRVLYNFYIVYSTT